MEMAGFLDASVITPFHTQIEQGFNCIEQKYLRIEQNVESKIELNKIKLNWTESRTNSKKAQKWNWIEQS